MSFLSDPSKYLREAMVARRARQREEAHAARQRERALHAKRHHQHPAVGQGQGQGQGRPFFQPHHKNGHPIPQEEDLDTEQSSSIHFTSNWKSIADFFPSIFSPKELEIDESEEFVTTTDAISENNGSKLKIDLAAPVIHVRDEGSGYKGQIQVLSSGGSNTPQSFDLDMTTASPGSSGSHLVPTNLAGDDDRGQGHKLKGNHDQNPMDNVAGSSSFLPEGGTPGHETLLIIDRNSTGDRFLEHPDEIEIIPFEEPESVPSGPISLSELSDCWGPCRCHRYAVSRKLEGSCARQSIFLRRVMSVLAVQYALVIIWMGVVKGVPEISRVMVDYFNYSYIPLGIFILSKLLLRSMVKIRKLQPWVLILIACSRVICIAYYCGAVTAFAKDETILLTAILLLLSSAFFALSAKFVNYDVRNSEIIGMSAVVNIVLSIVISFPYIICNLETSSMLQILLVTWLPSFVASQIIIMFMIFDMKQIMTGWRFPLSESDWIFTVLYV